MIMKTDGKPFATEMAANCRRGVLSKKDGINAKVVKVEDGWAIEETGPAKKAPSQEPSSKREPRRKERIAIGSRRLLNYPKIPGFHTRVVTDRDDGRIQAFKDAYWEPVHDSDFRGDDQLVQDASPMGSTVGKPVGGGRHGILMKLKDEYRKADLAEKARKVDETEEGMRMKKNEAPEGEYGSVSIDR